MLNRLVELAVKGLTMNKHPKNTLHLYAKVNVYQNTVNYETLFKNTLQYEVLFKKKKKKHLKYKILCPLDFWLTFFTMPYRNINIMLNVKTLCYQIVVIYPAASLKSRKSLIISLQKYKN